MRVLRLPTLPRSGVPSLSYDRQIVRLTSEYEATCYDRLSSKRNLRRNGKRDEYSQTISAHFH